MSCHAACGENRHIAANLPILLGPWRYVAILYKIDVNDRPHEMKVRGLLTRNNFFTFTKNRKYLKQSCFTIADLFSLNTYEACSNGPGRQHWTGPVPFLEINL